MQTHGRPGCHYMHLENAYLLRVAAPHELKTKFDPRSRNQHRIETDVPADCCRCCSGPTSQQHPLPPGLVATTVMEKGFMMKQPLCFGCANGVAQVMLGTCAEPGGIKSGSRVDQVQAGSNYLVERAEARNKFDEEREKRRAAASKHFQQVLQATAATPALSELLSVLDDGDESEVTSVEEMSDDAESLDSLDIDPAGAPPPGGEGEPAPLDTPDLSHLLAAGLDDD